jgi:hypothetical protein
VLLRLEPRGARELLTDPQEAAHLVSQVGERLVVHAVGGTRLGARAHRSTVSRRDSSTITV